MTNVGPAEEKRLDVTGSVLLISLNGVSGHTRRFDRSLYLLTRRFAVPTQNVIAGYMAVSVENRVAIGSAPRPFRRGWGEGDINNLRLYSAVVYCVDRKRLGYTSFFSQRVYQKLFSLRSKIILYLQTNYRHVDRM